MNITLHQLAVLQAVNQTGSMTGAAGSLHVTQPAISNSLKQLEKLFNAPLVDTVGRQTRLTQLGERVLQTAITVQGALDQLHQDVMAMQSTLAGAMTVTIVSTAKYFVPKLLGSFKHQHPEIDIKLKVCNREEAVEVLKQRRSDFLIMSQPPKQLSVDVQPFYDDELVVAASPALAARYRSRRRLSLKQLANEDWIIREPGSGTRIMMLQLLKEAGISTRFKMEVGNNESIKQLVMADMGLSVLSRQSIELELKEGLITSLPVSGFPLAHPWYLVVHRRQHLSPLTQAFYAYARTHSEVAHINS